VDTGATRTALVSSDAFNYGAILTTLLPLSKNSYTGIGEGSVQAYKLENTTLRFATSIGHYDITQMDLDILSTTDPDLSSMLGIDILCKFDIMPEDQFRIVLRKRTDIT
jgi:hypothetical protein